MCFCLLQSSRIAISAKVLASTLHCRWIYPQLLHPGCDWLDRIRWLRWALAESLFKKSVANCVCWLVFFFFCSWSYLHVLNCSFPPTDPAATGFIISPWSLLLMPSGNISFTDEYVTQQDLKAFTAPEVLEGLSLNSISDMEKVKSSYDPTRGNRSIQIVRPKCMFYHFPPPQISC